MSTLYQSLEKKKDVKIIMNTRMAGFSGGGSILGNFTSSINMEADWCSANI